ncbi:chemotaxis protein CheW [Candidatus Methylospira mobilis]|uniref:Chemotaxis protein CheW n=1 Tax=Candidatus Methylospira mobilis TaxID=1808979 RepID=A0A5Q0BEI9_9GAMM|nr:chemotaxis protein CheW [Candidatus Methylospira mobilis]QFY41552.1 chemotaxis protein CheW [Candidatus Methylospira mobilis]WNV05208.1 chemotaxis protein CheW [Candidatus Methylospira mobilis]
MSSTLPNTGSREINLPYLMRFMGGLQEDQRSLQEIQAVYDNLTLLGQLLCAGTDITGMRRDFNQLAKELMDQLALQFHKKAVLGLQFSARIAIDILIRNLFERTADIGFLATDRDIRRCAEMVHDASRRCDKSALVGRFREYVNKYSVYHNIILLAPDGRVLAQLDAENEVYNSQDPLIEQSLTTANAYVETFRPTDLLPGENSPLIYSYRVMSEDGETPLGVLCLCFRFADECQRIFENLLTPGDWRVLIILGEDDKIIASSDIYQFPIGAKLERIADDDCRIVRFAGREYLATTCQTKGYQGYSGPGWSGYALAPLVHAFEMAEAREIEHVPAALRDCVFETATLFSPELRDIPLRAASIQSELDRAVWNGNVWLAAQGDDQALNRSFAKVLLREIGLTGIRTRNVFSESISNLYKAVISSALYDCASQAALAIDIMDRNLYERANDCRWWALTGAFREALSTTANIADDSAKQSQLTAILRTINGLYTVYSNLLLFDRVAQVVAVSSTAHTDLVGHRLQGEWVRKTLALPDTESYCVSAFDATALYEDAPTYVYAAAVRSMENGNGESTPVGGIAIVFDSTPQFEAMLQDALPRTEEGTLIEDAFAIFADRQGRVIASTNPAIAPGSEFPIARQFSRLSAGEGYADIIEYTDRYYAIGACMSKGYREYKGPDDAYRNDVLALVLAPLSQSTVKQPNLQLLQRLTEDSHVHQHNFGDDTIDLATFYIGNQWYAVYLDSVVEAVFAPTVIPIPCSPSWQRFGCMRHAKQIIAVYDLLQLLPEADGSSLNQAVIVRNKENGQNFAIMVTRLGEIVEINRSRITPIPGASSNDRTIAESVVNPLSNDEPASNVLVILSIDNIYRLVSGLQLDALQQPGEGI